MNRRFLATVILCAVLPLLGAAAVLYRTYAGTERRDTVNTLTLEAEYKSREIYNYLALKKQALETLSGLGVFPVAVEYQRFEGLTRLFDSMMKNEQGYAGVCFLDKDRRIRAVNEVSSDGKFLEGGRAALARYAAGADFRSVRPWQVVEAGGVLAPVVISKVAGENGGHIGYLMAVLNPREFDAMLSSFIEKYQKMHGVSLQYLAAVKSGGDYLPLVRSSGFDSPAVRADGNHSGLLETAGKVSVWNTYGHDYGVRTAFQVPSAALLSRLREIRVLFFSAIPLLVLAFSALIVYITKYSFRSIEALLEKMEDMSKGNYSRIDRPGFAGDKYIDYANRLIDRIISYEEAARREVQLSALGKLASQVAHDIRSPLAALDSIEKDLAQLPEEKRVIIRGSVGRIRDIANDLIEKNRQLPGNGAAGPGAAQAAEPASTQLLSSLVEPVVTEKRLQYRSKMGVDIDARFERESYGFFANVQPAEFKRVISNIMNNAVEALDMKGAVALAMAPDADGGIAITIKDNGKGIPPEVLGRLFRRGETHGKAGGSGLGLFHAREALARWGGSIELSSEPGKGTEARIRLPRAETPAWFLPGVDLEPGTPVVVLDDDMSIHQVWQGRFESLRAGEQGVALLHFSTPAEIRAWAAASPEAVRKAVYLLDYELLGYQETGLSLAEELGLGPRAALVTSRYEEKDIVQNCLRLKIKLMPKGLAGHIPVTIAHSTAARPAAGPAVLIDDDALVRMNWKAAAREKKIELKVFSSPAEFYAAGDIPKDAAIYIDSNLGDGIKGEELARELKEKGYSRLCLETGHQPEKFAHIPWLRVTGKEPPWA